ncbi:MAG TPA: IS21 family transposase [Chthoniobacterales bacterium]
MDLKMLKLQGHSIRKIVQLSGLSRNTVRRVLRDKAPQPFQTPERGSKLDPFKEYVTARFRASGLSAVRLLEETQAQGYRGSVMTLRRFLRTLKADAQAQQKATVRFETAAGQQAQVDWAYCGPFKDEGGCPLKVYAFVMVLGFSRALYSCFTTSMDLATLLDCHQQAFASLGGIPKEILYDNMKQVRLNPHQWNPQFLDFAHYYGFVPRTCRIYRPRTKGKVERAIHYLKTNFLAGRSFADLAELNAQNQHWLNEVANVRLHATTQARPVDLLAQEHLQPYGAVKPYQLVIPATRKVDAEGFVRFQKSRYSVPPEHCGKVVSIQQKDRRILIQCQELILAEHDVAPRAGSCVAQPEHLQALWKRSTEPNRAPLPNWQLRFDHAVVTTPLSVYQEVA